MFSSANNHNITMPIYKEMCSKNNIIGKRAMGQLLAVNVPFSNACTQNSDIQFNFHPTPVKGRKGIHSYAHWHIR
jgi:hypothetical protein